MKKILLIAIMLMPPLAYADQAKEYCKSINRVAGQIMEARQGGATLAQVVELTDSNVLQGIIMDAYDRPRFHNDDFIRREVTDFQDKWYMACLRQYPSA